jgi:hypothetical protein
MHRAAVRLLHCHGASLDPLEVLEVCLHHDPLFASTIFWFLGDEHTMYWHPDGCYLSFQSSATSHKKRCGYWNAKYKSSAEILFEFWMNQSKGLVPGLSMHCLQICCFHWLLRQLLAWRPLMFTAVKFRSFLLSLHEHVFIHICFIPSY